MADVVVVLASSSSRGLDEAMGGVVQRKGESNRNERLFLRQNSISLLREKLQPIIVCSVTMQLLGKWPFPPKERRWREEK